MCKQKSISLLFIFYMCVCIENTRKTMDTLLRAKLVTLYLWRKAILNRRRAEKKKNNRRRFWIRPLYQQRNILGAGTTLVEEMRDNPHNLHNNFFRMSSEAFDRLLSLVGHHIAKCDSRREPISPHIRLSITLRYLASGDSMTSLTYLFRVGKATISNIISETLAAIWNVLMPVVLVPPTEEEWKKISEQFEQFWNFPNCIGALDGKHVTIQAPPNAGSSYYNYKGSHSIVLMALVDAQYQFILVDIGAEGRKSDGGIFKNCLIGQKLSNKTMGIPPPRVISEGRPPLPFVIVGDEAFPLMANLMRPYPGKDDNDIEQRIYNYRHSRARRLSENAFGILVARWRIFQRPIIAKTDNIENIVKAAVCLQNFIIKYDKNAYVTPTLVDHEEEGTVIPGSWRDFPSTFTPIRQTGSNMYGKDAREVRDIFKEYFNEEGAVPWQWKIF